MPEYVLKQDYDALLAKLAAVEAELAQSQARWAAASDRLLDLDEVVAQTLNTLGQHGVTRRPRGRLTY